MCVLYVSNDRGRTWSLRAQDTNLASPDRSGLPLQDGAVALAAPSTNRFYIGTENTFFMSVDGGRHWRRVLIGNSGYGYGVDAIDFVDALHGWASLDDGSLGSALIATDDGLHWGPVVAGSDVSIHLPVSAMRSRLSGEQLICPDLKRPVGVSRHTTTWSPSMSCTSPHWPWR